MKLLYKPVSILASVLGGLLAGAIFKRVWKAAAGEEEAPRATDASRGWREVLIAAALQGAIFALVKAAVDRSAAVGTRRLTGFWPGETGQARGDGQARDDGKGRDDGSGRDDGKARGQAEARGGKKGGTRA